MGAVTQKHSLDTWVNAASPSTNYVTSSTLQLKANERVAFVYFGTGFPLGATILSAKLTLRTYAIAGAGSRSITVRRSQGRAYFSSLTWDSAPQGVTGPGEPKTVTKSGALPGATEWVFDVTTHLQSVASGDTWSGWRVETDSTEILKVYGVDGAKHEPELTVTWSDAPDTPEALHPAGGRTISTPKPVLRWDYTDVAGDTEMGALQVRIADNEGMSGAWDSGIVPASVPELALEGTTYPGIPAGGTVWWQVRVSDGAGLWSGWSDPAAMTYEIPGTLTLISPTPNGTVASPATLDDATPVISWALTGATQEAYRVRVWRNTNPKHPLWDSARRTSTTQSITVPKGVMRWDDRRYRVQVDVWDNRDRVTTPGATAAYTAETIAFLNWDQALAGVDDLAATALNPFPFVELTWSRDPAPDGWVIVRNGEIIADLDYRDALDDDGTCRWVDRYAQPRTELTYVVRPRVNGKTAWGNPSATVLTEPVGVWLVTDDDEVCIVETDDGSWSMPDRSTLHEPVDGDAPPVQISQGMRGYEGTMSGLLTSDILDLDGISARDWRDAFLRIKRRRSAHLMVSSLSFPVLLADMVPAPTSDPDEEWAVSFAFWQATPFDWDAL